MLCVSLRVVSRSRCSSWRRAPASARSRRTARSNRSACRAARPSACRRLQQEADRLALRGAHAARRSAPARGRRGRSGRGAPTARNADVAAGGWRTPRGSTRRLPRLEQEEHAERPELRARLVSCTSSARAATCGCCCPPPTSRASGRPRGWSRSLASQDRDRIAAHQRRLEELSASRRQLQDRSARLAALREAAERAPARGRPRGRGPQRADRRASTAARPQRAARGRARRPRSRSLQATLADGRRRRAAAEPLPLRPFRGDLDWPVAGTVRQRFGAPGRPAAPPNGIEIAARRRRAGARHPRRHGRVCRRVHRLRQPGHRRSRRQTFSLYGNCSRSPSARGPASSAAQQSARSGVAPTGRAGPVFRASRRRSAGRSLTMAEDASSRPMSSTTRRVVLWISAPVVAFAIVGGFLSRSRRARTPTSTSRSSTTWSA